MSDSFFGFSTTLPVSRQPSGAIEPTKCPPERVLRGRNRPRKRVMLATLAMGLRKSAPTTAATEAPFVIRVYACALQGDDDGLRDDDEDSELEYDALNDETFGSAIKGDWENLHENLVQQLGRKIAPNTNADDDDDDDEDIDDLTGLPTKNNGEGHGSGFRNDFHSLGKDHQHFGSSIIGLRY